MKKITTKIGVLTVVTLPLITFAATNNLKDLIDLIVKYFNAGIVLIIGLATIMFVWNVYKYFIASADDAGAKKDAGLYVMYSVIGFFVILSFWGLVNILTNTLNLNSNMPALPFGQFNSSNTSNRVQTGTDSTTIPK